MIMLPASEVSRLPFDPFYEHLCARFSHTIHKEEMEIEDRAGHMARKEEKRQEELRRKRCQERQLEARRRVPLFSITDKGMGKGTTVVPGSQSAKGKGKGKDAVQAVALEGGSDAESSSEEIRSAGSSSDSSED